MSKFKKWVAANGGTRATARLLGVSHVAVSNWLTGKNGISRKHVKLILHAAKGFRQRSPLTIEDLYNVTN